MSGGTPKCCAYVRQRHSQGYASSCEDLDLEDDASSRTPVSAHVPKSSSWILVLENVLWIASAAFIIYFGDRSSNLFSLLYRDDRIRRTALNLGFASIVLNGGIIVYTALFAWDVRKANGKWELSTPTALPIVTILGLVSFCLFSFALWPIWSFLTLPLLFTLFMAFMVIIPYIVPLGKFRSHVDLLRAD